MATTATGNRPDPLGVGVIGAGGILRLHALALRSLPEHARLVAVCDLDRSRAEAARRTYGFEEACGGHRELLAREDVDVAILCTRPNTHAALVEDALAAGKHVLCEKPMAHTLADADRIVAAGDARPDRKLSFVYQWRNEPGYRRLHALAAGGRLGQLLTAGLQVKARRSDAYYASGADRGGWATDGGGMLMVIAIHQLDLLLHLLGRPVLVSARMDTFLKPTSGEDTLVAWVRFESGALATLRCSVCEHENDNFTLELLAEKGSVRLAGGPLRGAPSPNVCTWTLTARDEATRRALDDFGFARCPAPRREPPRLWMRLREEWEKRRGRLWLPPSHWWHTPTVREFLECVEQDAPAPVPAREARRSLELVVALYESALTGEQVALPLDERSPMYGGVTAPEEHARQEVATR